MRSFASKIVADFYADRDERHLSQDRIDSLRSIKQITDYDDYNIYTMDVYYDYDIDAATPYVDGTPSTELLMQGLLEQVAPGIKIDYKVPSFGCSAFALQDENGIWRMGRNYDFSFNSSAMLVDCHPTNGYASIGYAALSMLNANDPSQGVLPLFSCLAAPFICFDGVNEKGVSIAVLTLDSEPTCQRTGKPVLSTVMLIRLVLDRAATTQEAVDLVSQYDAFAMAGRDYHFFVTDAQGDSRIIEFDCDSSNRDMVVTKTRAVTNFFIMHDGKVTSNGKNGIYGHGKDRYDTIERLLDEHDGVGGKYVVWEALVAASQEPNPESITSNTQWSVVYDNGTQACEIALRRRWDDKFSFRP